MKLVVGIAFLLVVLGAINWGLVGLFNVDVVAAIFGEGGVANVVYILVGLSGLYVGATMLPKQFS